MPTMAHNETICTRQTLFQNNSVQKQSPPRQHTRFSERRHIKRDTVYNIGVHTKRCRHILLRCCQYPSRNGTVSAMQPVSMSGIHSHSMSPCMSEIVCGGNIYSGMGSPIMHQDRDTDIVAWPCNVTSSSSLCLCPRLVVLRRDSRQ